ncbi:unnamed protein product [Nippostrongylus brasiliensis]|uniref:Transcription repressor n=1 Tax=Nippostrongylus brasiliensis TaxID=27835 RepID=A0A0N4XYP0_NIPBR|nr:unnamed protein product [Nippostrongylus brasiliensis]
MAPHRSGIRRKKEKELRFSAHGKRSHQMMLPRLFGRKNPPAVPLCASSSESSTSHKSESEKKKESKPTKTERPKKDMDLQQFNQLIVHMQSSDNTERSDAEKVYSEVALAPKASLLFSLYCTADAPFEVRTITRISNVSEGVLTWAYQGMPPTSHGTLN